MKRFEIRSRRWKRARRSDQFCDIMAESIDEARAVFGVLFPAHHIVSVFEV